MTVTITSPNLERPLRITGRGIDHCEEIRQRDDGTFVCCADRENDPLGESNRQERAQGRPSTLGAIGDALTHVTYRSGGR